MIGCDRALVSAEDPALQTAGYPMDTGMVTWAGSPDEYSISSRVSAGRCIQGTGSRNGTHEWREKIARGIVNATHPKAAEIHGAEHVDGDNHH